MKIIYCIASVYNPGGMERVLLNKVRWLVARGGFDLAVITTDQQGRPPFYEFPPEVRMIDLGINYSLDNGKNPIVKILSYFRKRRSHREALTEVLLREKADIVVSLYPSESSFIPSIKDGSKKILELHFNRYFRLQYGRKGILGLADRFRSWQDKRIVRKFDRFVVLTEEDAGYWGSVPNIEVIPNAAPAIPVVNPVQKENRVLAVGRLDYQKGFDRLIEAWAMIPSSSRQGWRLDIIGQGEWKEMLCGMIERLGISDSASILPPTGKIFEEYAKSAFLVMSSHFEGFPMVMIEAMSQGLPVVTFGFKCGPRDIIEDGWNGVIVPEGDVPALARGIETLILDRSLMENMGRKASLVSERYSEDKVMRAWLGCFDKVMTI